MEDIKQELPEAEILKRELMAKFEANRNYMGSVIKKEIQQFSLRQSKPINKPTYITKGDVIVAYEGKKSRPCVVLKVLRDKTVLYCGLTGSDNVHCMSPSKSRFFGEGCFSKTFGVCTEEFAMENFAGIYDNMKLVNRAIKELREFVNLNL